MTATTDGAPMVGSSTSINTGPAPSVPGRAGASGEEASVSTGVRPYSAPFFGQESQASLRYGAGHGLAPRQRLLRRPVQGRARRPLRVGGTRCHRLPEGPGGPPGVDEVGRRPGQGHRVAAQGAAPEIAPPSGG